MTAQVSERLHYNGELYRLATEPLYPYIKAHNLHFAAHNSSCWRGYVGEWLIEENRLYLIGLTGTIRNNPHSISSDTDCAMKALFPGQERVFAEWFSGELRIPYGRLLKYVHSGYNSIYHKELFLTVEAGVVVDSREIENQPPLGLFVAFDDDEEI